RWCVSRTSSSTRFHPGRVPVETCCGTPSTSISTPEPPSAREFCLRRSWHGVAACTRGRVDRLGRFDGRSVQRRRLGRDLLTLAHRAGRGAVAERPAAELVPEVRFQPVRQVRTLGHDLARIHVLVYHVVVLLDLGEVHCVPE